ncbi:CaiB/BaiF CoA transferase family protein [Candidatus Poriferisocius sp.]|uniref:CaiB/BaiF CoA transferase family protein n=1 Tax=Candidatus Poriferisocius sp. TaxID=3101276 RepID=UPI003B026AD4
MKPLEGVRVVDLTRVVSGPVCTWFLASLGAEVIRVDPPGGDVTWRIPPWVGAEGEQSEAMGPDDIGISYLRKGRGKRSVVLDLGRPEGADAFRRLAANVDVLVDNFRPGVMDSLGVGYETLSALNPRLIHASITGYGPDGPDADLASMDLIIQGRSGLMAKSGFPDGPPIKAGATVGDQFPAALCALGVVAALRQRDIDGKGQYIDVAMLDSLVTMLWDEPLDLYRERGMPDRIGNGDPRGILDTFESQDGWVTLVITSDAQFERLTEEMGRPDLFELGPNIPVRASNRAEICEGVAAWMAQQTTDELVARLHKIRVPAGAVASAYAAGDDPQIQHRQALVPLRHPQSDGPTNRLGPAFPIKFSRSNTDQSPAETLGASTHSVLKSIAGLTQEEIDRLHSAGVLG